LSTALHTNQLSTVVCINCNTLQHTCCLLSRWVTRLCLCHIRQPLPWLSHIHKTYGRGAQITGDYILYDFEFVHHRWSYVTPYQFFLPMYKPHQTNHCYRIDLFMNTLNDLMMVQHMNRNMLSTDKS
jgi:hypothetical protein